MTQPVITDEMRQAGIDGEVSHILANGFGHEGAQDSRMDAILTAAYPLIRDAVLAEAAAMCEYKYKGHASIYGTEQAESYEHAATICAQAIRALMSGELVAVPKEGE